MSELMKMKSVLTGLGKDAGGMSGAIGALNKRVKVTGDMAEAQIRGTSKVREFNELKGACDDAEKKLAAAVEALTTVKAKCHAISDHL